MGRILRLLFGEFRVSWWRTLAQLVRGRRILVGRRFTVIGHPVLIGPAARLTLGTLPYGFASGRDRGLLRIRGGMTVRGHVAIGVGSRFDVGPDARVDIGEDCYFSPFVRVIASNEVRFGTSCAIGWDVQILDDDQHQFDGGRGPKAQSAPIVIGDRVWIGSGARIFKGVEIADGCVVAGGSVVTRSVLEADCLIAGNPAQVVRRGIHWA